MKNLTLFFGQRLLTILYHLWATFLNFPQTWRASQLFVFPTLDYFFGQYLLWPKILSACCVFWPAKFAAEIDLAPKISQNIFLTCFQSEVETKKPGLPNWRWSRSNSWAGENSIDQARLEAEQTHLDKTGADLIFEHLIPSRFF